MGLTRDEGRGELIVTTEVDFGSTPIEEKSFTITDTNATTSHKVIAQIAYLAPTGKDLDEVEMDSFTLRGVSNAGSVTIFITCLTGLVIDKFKITYIKI